MINKGAKDDTGKLVYAAPGDRAGLLVAESIMLLGVLGGVGSLPLLEERGLNWFWIVTLAAGLPTILAGIWYGIRQGRRANAAKSNASGWGRLALPRFAVLTGVLILLPALASWLALQQGQNAYPFEVYFSAPALFVWVAGMGYYALPLINTRPKHGPQIIGLIKSGLQALSALLLWVYLGLSIGLSDAGWMFWSALALGVIGGGLGILASVGESELTAAPGGQG